MAYKALLACHLVGFLLLGAGLIGVWIAELRSRQTHDLTIIAEACRSVSVMYRVGAFCGALIAIASGVLLVFHLGLGFLAAPWLIGMWAFALFEFVEGNTVTRLHAARMRRLSEDALRAGRVTPELRREMDNRLATFTHFLDLPLYFSIVVLGVFRPQTWDLFLGEALLSFAIASALTLYVPRRLPWPRIGETGASDGPGGARREPEASGAAS
jgi:uncharacterized membrane protein